MTPVITSYGEKANLLEGTHTYFIEVVDADSEFSATSIIPLDDYSMKKFLSFLHSMPADVSDEEAPSPASCSSKEGPDEF